MRPVTLRIVRDPPTGSTRVPIEAFAPLQRCARVCSARDTSRAIGELLADGQTTIAVELPDASSVDSAMLWTLLRAARIVRALGGQFGVVTGDRTVREILRITLLDAVLLIFPTRSAAVEHLEAA